MLTNPFAENDVLRWEDGHNKIVDISPKWHHAKFHVPWCGAPLLVEVSENSTSGPCNERLETAGTSKLGPLIPQQTDTDSDLKVLYMNNSEGRVHLNSLSQHDLSFKQCHSHTERENSAIMAVPGTSGSCLDDFSTQSDRRMEHIIRTTLSSNDLGNARYDDITVAMDSDSPMRFSGLTLRSAVLPKMGRISPRKLAATPCLVSLLLIILVCSFKNAWEVCIYLVNVLPIPMIQLILIITSKASYSLRILITA